MEDICIKLEGTIFDDGLDIRDVAFFSKRIANITEKAYSAYTNNSDKNYKIITKDISHSSLVIDLVLDYGLALAPLLTKNHLTILNTITLAIDAISKLSKFDNSTINIENSSINSMVISQKDINITIQNPVFHTMLNIVNDIDDINKKIKNNQISSLDINHTNIMDISTSTAISKGISIIKEQLEYEELDTTYTAELQVYEVNKQTMSAKATIIAHDMFGFEVDPNISLDIPSNECLDYLVLALKDGTIIIGFKPIVQQSLKSKKKLKTILIQECKDI